MGGEEENNDVISLLSEALKASNSNNNENEDTSDQTGGQSTTGGNKNDSTSVQVPERVFTQDEVSKMMAKEKHQGRNAVYKELGIDPEDTSAVKMFKAFIEAQKTKEEKEAEADAERNKQIADMSAKLKNAEAKAVLMQAGVSADYVDDAVTIALARISADESLDIETVAKDLKSKYSVWFGSGTNEVPENKNKNNVGKRGTGKTASNGSNNTTGNNTISGIGKRLAENRKASIPKTSLWGE